MHISNGPESRTLTEGGEDMEEKAKLKTLKGIGDKTAALFARLGIFTVEDLLRHYPL